MSTLHLLYPVPRSARRQAGTGFRRGVIAIMTAFLLPVLLAFVALSVDTGNIALTQTQMQNAVDAAALAASQEITSAVHAAAQGEGDALIDASSIAVAEARNMAFDVAAANGVHIDPATDVLFGKRVYDPATNDWPIVWDAEPYNVLRVVAQRDNPDTSAPDGRLVLAFGGFVGKPTMELTASATAFVEARDMVVVLDFSASMNDDTEFFPYGHSNPLPQSVIKGAQAAMWDALVAADPKWPDTGLSKFPESGFGKLNVYRGKTSVTDINNPNNTVYFSNLTNSYDIYRQLRLHKTDSSGNPRYPFPQAGKDSSGNLRDTPSAATSESKWRDYIKHVRDLPSWHSHHRRYGYRTLMDYLQSKRSRNKDSEDLWRTPHYPFHAIKDGASLLCSFLESLDFGDELGLVTYDSNSRVEKILHDGNENIDISDDPITTNYAAIDTIQRHKQAGHYDGWTGMGYGIKEARLLLRDHSRYGARPTILVMTDGQANRYPSGWNLPGDWKWSEWTDYNDDGTADYSTSNRAKQYAFYEAVEAITRGSTVHTMSVGTDADDDLMRAIAFAGGGLWIDVPGGTTIAEMEDQLLEAFGQIASKVPPAKLVYDDTAQP